MKLSRLLPLLFVLTVVVYYGCRKAETSLEPTGEHIVDNIRASVSGRVTDGEKVPVGGATVTAGGATTTTDVDGNFYFSDVTLDRTAGLIKVEKDGFFTGYKTLMLQTGDNNNTALELVKKTVTGTFDVAAGGIVNMPNDGGSIQFAPNAVINEITKQPYKGTVVVYAAAIHPDMDNFYDIMPGTLRGIDKHNKEMGLQSFGMVGAELYSVSGEKLQLAPGITATWRMPVPQTLKVHAPADIALWSFNETTGLWKEEGKAVKMEDEYVGVLTHFSFWNCDAPFKVVKLKARLFAEDAPLANARVTITTALGNNNISGSGYTSGDGIIEGLVPANQKLALNVYNKCGDLVYAQEINPLFFDTDLGEISMHAGYSMIRVSGTVLNCERQAVQRGSVTLKVDAFVYRANVSNGRFSIMVARCTSGPAMATIVADDADKKMISEALEFEVNGNDLDAGEISVCAESAEQYIDMTFGADRIMLMPPGDSISLSTDANASYVYAFNTTSSMQLFINGQPGKTGDFSGAFYYQEDRKSWSSNNMPVTVTRYDAATGGFIEGRFAGTVSDSTNTTPMSATFRIRRN